MFCWLVPRHEAKVAAATWTKIRLPQQHVSGGANRSPRTPRATGREGEWLAALVVRLQFYAAPESGGRQPQHPSRSKQPLSL